MTDEELTVAEGRSLFDKAAREKLGVSGDEFLRRYDTNDIPPEWPHQHVAWLEVLTPFGRQPDTIAPPARPTGLNRANFPKLPERGDPRCAGCCATLATTATPAEVDATTTHT